MQDQARLRRGRGRARRACVAAVWARAGGRCEGCQRRVQPAREAASYDTVGHVHERRPRSLGGDATDPEQGVLLCVVCHGEAHGLRVGTRTPLWRQD